MQPLPGQQGGCEGTYGFGYRLVLSGAGFRPGTAIRVLVSSPVLGPSGERLVAQIRANQDGRLAGTVQLPLAASHAASAATPGLAFVDAIGLAPDGAHLDDTATIGLAGPEARCGSTSGRF